MHRLGGFSVVEHAAGLFPNGLAAAFYELSVPSAKNILTETNLSAHQEVELWGRQRQAILLRVPNMRIISRMDGAKGEEI